MNKKVDCNLLVVCGNNVILCQVRRIIFMKLLIFVQLLIFQPFHFSELSILLLISHWSFFSL